MTVVHRPNSLREAVALLGEHPDLMVMAGATDIYPAYTQRKGWGDFVHRDLLDVTALSDLRGIEDRGDHWWIGAAMTWSEIVHADLPPLFNGLKAAAREIGGVQIQNRGTIGGNIITASPAGDGLPCLMALDAEIEVVGGVQFRVPINRFLTGYRKTALGAGELVTGVRIPKQAGRGYFLKLGARRYLVISIAMVSGVFDVATDGGVRSAKVAVGASSAVAQRLPALEAALTGQRLDPTLVLAEYFADLAPIDDVRASAAYRRQAALTLARDLVRSAAGTERDAS